MILCRWKSLIKKNILGLIENEKNLVLPKAYEMRILIQTKNNKTIDVGGIPSNGILTISGKKYFITNEDYAEVNYWIWQKE